MSPPQFPGGFSEKPEHYYHETSDREYIYHPEERPQRGRDVMYAHEFTKPLPAGWDIEGIENNLLDVGRVRYDLKEWVVKIWVPSRHTPERVLALEGKAVLHLYGHWRCHVFRIWVKEGEGLE